MFSGKLDARFGSTSLKDCWRSLRRRMRLPESRKLIILAYNTLEFFFILQIQIYLAYLRIRSDGSLSGRKLPQALNSTLGLHLPKTVPKV
jgi:hypothetical protein